MTDIVHFKPYKKANFSLIVIFVNKQKYKLLKRNFFYLNTHLTLKTAHKPTI